MAEVEFNVPALGERGDLTDRELPPQALRLCQNMWRNERGNLVIRPGYQMLSATNPADRVMGLHYFRTAAAADRLIAGTLTKVWAYNYSSEIWEDKSGTALSGSTTDHVRCATFNVSGTFKVVITNGANTAKIWDGAAGTYSTLGGSPTGTPLDAKVAANRLLLLRKPFNVQVSEFNNPESFPSGNGMNAALIDSGDFAVGMERFNRTSVAILGDESQWVARAQTGSIPFRFEKITEFSGPLSSASIVAANGKVYYLARDYNVYAFDGVGCLPVGWAMRPFVEDNIDSGNQGMTHGVYYDKHGKIIWWFPPAGLTQPTLGIFYDIRTEEMGRVLYGTGITAAARIQVATGITWADLSGYTWDNLAVDFPTWDSFGSLSNRREIALGVSAGPVHIAGSGDGSDNDLPIEVIWEVPLHSYGGFPKDFVPSTFETFLKKTANSTTVMPSVGYTDTLMETPTYVAMSSFDLATAQRNDIDLTSVGQHRFVTIRHQVSAFKGQIAWQGGLMRGESAGIEAGPTGVD